MVPLPFDGLLAFEARLVACWSSSSWYRRRGSLACSFGLLGLRWSEVEVVRPGDVSVDAETLFVRTRKRGQPRTIPVTRDLLEAALAMRGAIAGGDDRVFVTRGGRGMVYQDVRRFVARCTRLAFGRPFSFHCFRHTAAVRVYRRTRDVVAVKQYLGHKSLQWTQSYLASLEVVDVGGPVAFAGGGPAVKPKLFVPAVGELEVKDVQGSGADRLCSENPGSAGGHRCEDQAIPFRHGDGVRLRCKVCSRVLPWPTGSAAASGEVVRLLGEGGGRSLRERETSERSTPAIDAAGLAAEGADCSLRERETWERVQPAIDAAAVAADSVTCDHVQPWCDGDRRPLGTWRVELSGSGRRRVACRVCGRWFGDLAGVDPDVVAKRVARKVARQQRLF